MKSAVIFIFLLAATVVSCRENMEVSMPSSAEKAVIEGYVSSEQDSSYVKVSRTHPVYTPNVVPPVSDAFVRVNADTFFYAGNGTYKPRSPYKGHVGKPYLLRVNYGGKEYVSASLMAPLIKIGSEFKPVYHAREGFIKEGYSVSVNFSFAYPFQYTYFRAGFKNEVNTKGRDSIYDIMVMTAGKHFKYNEMQTMEIPLMRLQPNDTALLVFKSCDRSAFDYYNQISSNTLTATPFSNPPVNLPTNILGGAIGFFAAQEVRHFRIKITP